MRAYFISGCAGTVLLGWACAMLAAADPGPVRPAARGAAATRPAPPAPAGIAVIELFTSEGCSSCPPADEALADIRASALREEKRVYPLAFHVDYWNRLGWTDPYSDAAYSDRQRAYAEAFRTDEIYTPQMIVNGREEFTGSDRGRAARAIQTALEKPAAVTLTVAAESLQGDALTVRYTAASSPAGAVVCVAVVESGLETGVKRGENAGRRLRHENVVRAFQRSKLDHGEEGRAVLKLPAAMVRDHARVIAYLQDISTMAILGAADSPLPAPAAPASRPAARR